MIHLTGLGFRIEAFSHQPDQIALHLSLLRPDGLHVDLQARVAQQLLHNLRILSICIQQSPKRVPVTEEEKHILPVGDSNVVRVTYNPDVNGELQPVQREIVESKKIAEDLEETNGTVMLSSINGGLAPAFKTHETCKRVANDTVKTETTHGFPTLTESGNGAKFGKTLRRKKKTTAKLRRQSPGPMQRGS